MSVHKEAEGASKARSTNCKPPTKGEIERHLAALEQRGVLAELPCCECGATVETTVPPEAKGDENQRTLCRSCGADHLREKGLL